MLIIRVNLQNEGFSIIIYKEILPKTQLVNIPIKAGIYALFWGESCRYIGKSEQLQIRLKKHDSEKIKSFGHFSWYQIRSDRIDAAEKMLVCFYKPKLNENLKDC